MKGLPPEMLQHFDDDLIFQRATIDFQETVTRDQKEIRETLKSTNNNITNYHDGLDKRMDTLEALITANTTITTETASRMKHLYGLSTFAEGVEKIGPGWRYLLGIIALLTTFYFWGKLLFFKIISLIVLK